MKKSSLSVAPYLHYIARLLDVQGVSGSSPLAPTKTSETSVSEVFLFIKMTVSERSCPHRAEIQASGGFHLLQTVGSAHSPSMCPRLHCRRRHTRPCALPGQSGTQVLWHLHFMRFSPAAFWRRAEQGLRHRACRFRLNRQQARLCRSAPSPRRVHAAKSAGQPYSRCRKR